MSRRSMLGLLDRYTDAAEAGSATVIARYSTSFGAAAKLLDAETRRRIRSVYALVRVADEIVDGAAAEAGLSPDELHEVLDGLEADTERAMRLGYSANLVVHAFAKVARETGFGVELTRPFFASMRRDLDPAPFTSEEIGPYIHGSAEVVGLMCLAAFLVDEPADEARRARLERGAIHLGAAFQKINFLRDLAVDWRTLGRNYFPGVDPEAFTEEDKTAILDDIDRDLEIARSALPELPRRARSAVATAHGLFASLTARCRTTPASEIMATRIRVPDGEKLAIAVRSALGTGGNRR
ncbi:MULTISPECIES: squalene/phytoene synthase family protein [unclassified Agromyces]|uniref:phytoene/squalene synthase family protein n=1 Tax=unclassified Agromyces TaxID=2639701 RepID=UPI0007B1E985|nr:MULTISPECIES: squalene/phytoene synthase family protein [unclassified Agromyces]KZE95463.1 15-cis-phytoene synthase [Agromyces sp. NDB4Y10]MCK8609554.1 squalene/phytoene synthase family protein [Agromyces sp. C10]